MFDCPTYKFPTGQLPAWRIAVHFISGFANLFAAIGAFFFVGSILSRKKVYTNTLNLYVAFLLLPDAVHNLVVAVYSFFLTAYCDTSGPWRPVYEFMIFFYFFCNFYLNIVVAQEIYSLLEKTSRCQRAKPPPLKRGMAQIGLIYVLAILLGLWAVLEVPWSFFDHNFGSPKGGLFSDLAAYIFVGCLILIPLVYNIVICLMIRRKGLLPQEEGKTKSISIFFGRIIVVFFACYLPGLAVQIFCTTLNQRSTLFFWMSFTNQCLFVLQNLVTLYMISYKEDIWKVVCANFRACTCREPLPDKKSPVKNTRRVNRNRNHQTSVTVTEKTDSVEQSQVTNKTDSAEQSQVITQPKGTPGDVVQDDSVEIDVTDPEQPIDIIHPSIDNDNDNDNDNDDDDEGEENLVWVGPDL